MALGKQVLIEQQFLDADAGLELYIAGEFDTVEEAEAHKPVYAARRGQTVESIDFRIEDSATAEKLGAVYAD